MFNDAGVGSTRPASATSPPSSARGITAFTVSAASARIGEAVDLEDGVISRVTTATGRLGAVAGMRARDVLLAFQRKVVGALL